MPGRYNYAFDEGTYRVYPGEYYQMMSNSPHESNKDKYMSPIVCVEFDDAINFGLHTMGIKSVGWKEFKKSDVLYYLTTGLEIEVKMHKGNMSLLCMSVSLANEMYNTIRDYMTPVVPKNMLVPVSAPPSKMIRSITDAGRLIASLVIVGGVVFATTRCLYWTRRVRC